MIPKFMLSSMVNVSASTYSFILFLHYVAVMVLLGNKSDLESEREVSLNEALQYAANIDAKYFETSALSNQGERGKARYVCFML